MDTNITKVNMPNDIIHKIDDNITIIGKNIKKEWIRTPPQLGSVKLKVNDEFQTMCKCGDHITTLYILEKDYFTMYCDSKGWTWLSQPSDKKILYNLKIDMDKFLK